MSSHHFVKENQEPALLILSAKAIPFERVQELLEWSPTVMVADHELEQVLGWGIKIDVVISSEPQADYFKQLLNDQEPLQLITYRQETDILSVACQFLIAAKYKAVNILVNVISQLESVQSFVEIDVEVFCNNQRWVYVHSKKFEKWVSGGTQFYFYPDSLVDQMECSGLSTSMSSLADGMVTIRGKNAFWLGERLS
jgi:thiamine pyrophosphokinase